MALKKTTTAASFEQEPTDNVGADTGTPTVDQGTVGADAPAAAEAAAPTAEHQEAAASVKTTVAIAKVATSSTSVSLADAGNKAKEFQREVQAMKGASDFSYGNYRVFKGNNGEISESGGDQDVLGRWAKVRLMSWDDHYEISPGEDGSSTKDFVAYSKDGKVIDSVIGEELKSWVGKSVQEYAEHLKTVEEFAKTKVRRFVDTACALMATDNGEGPIGKVIQITLSESSIPAFSRYQQELADTARCVSMGLPGFALPEDPFTFFFIREVASKGNQKWTKLKIEQNLPAKV